MEKVIEYTFEILLTAFLFMNIFRMFFEVLMAVSY